jgi:vitamin B12 transporter
MLGRNLPLGAFGLLISAVAVAQTEQVRLAPINVTASRGAETTGETLASVTVITRKDIERQQPQTMLDLLRKQAGVDIATNGGLGTVSSVFLRGAESDQVLVLIDGVRAASTTSGTFAFQQLNPAQIERIEIVRGPRSNLYGSDAIGGVIQIFTRRLNGPNAAMEAGSYDTYRAQAGYGGGNRVHYSINGAYVYSGGFSATNPTSPFFNRDDDGYKEVSVTANLNAQLTKRASFALRGWRSDGEVEFDQGAIDTQNDTAALSFDLDTLPDWHQSFGAGYARDNQDTMAVPADFSSAATTNRITLNWQNDIRLADTHQLTAGADYYRDDGSFNFIDLTGAPNSFDESINNVGAYIYLRSIFDANDLELGLRYDQHSEFGAHTTGQIALGRQFTGSLRAFASFGTAFKAPTLNELFFPGFGNPNLDPESSRTTELGLTFQPPGASYRIDANAFYTKIDDLIETVFVGPSPNDFLARNVDEATIKGLELGYDWNLTARWHFSVDLTLQNARNDTLDMDLLRRPDRKAALSIARAFANDGSFYTELLLSGERIDVGGVRLPGYGVVNLGLQYPVLKGLYVEARVENLLDKEYELAASFNTPDRSGYLGLRYAPDSTK